MKKNKYLTVRQIYDSGDYPFTEGQIRAFLMDREKNGLTKCLRQIGKRIYIREDLFEEWIDKHNIIDGDSDDLA